ncbi:class II glutamine amidotransferase [Myxococcaceae bacterium JPH2]|nr:class II glutamine amidotransferase [Myxococcaceae bacterium JPH2]
MSVVLAALTSDPNLLRCELLRLGGQVRLQGDATPNAVGVGSYAQEEVLLRRFRAETELTLARVLPDIESEALLFHAQRLPMGLAHEENTQPFRARRWLFAHQGRVEGFERLRASLLAGLPDHLQRQVRGPTDSEVLFAVFLKHLRALGRTDDPRLEPEIAGDLLARTALEVARASAEAGVPRASNLNLLAANGAVLAATRLGELPLYYMRMEGSAACEACGVDARTSDIQPTLGAHRRQRTVVVASHLARPASWVELPSGATLVVGSDLQARTLTTP